MKIELTPKIEQWVQAQLADHRFSTPQEALEHLIDHRQALGKIYSDNELRSLWHEGVDSGPALDAGGNPVDGPASVKAIFDKHRPANR